MRIFQTLVISFILSGLISLTPLSGYGPIRAFSPFDSIESFPTSCAPLEPPMGTIIMVSSESELRDQVSNASSGSTILIQPGTYHMQNYLHITRDGLSLRGATGERAAVILDFGGMVGGHFGILVEADDVTIADLTIRNANDHGVSIQGRDNPVLYNLHILDIGDQLVKVNPWGDGSEDGLLACSRLEYTTTAPDDYTNGISAHNAHRWVLRDNEWYRIRGNTGDTGPAILFWNGSSDTTIERNLLVDCFRGIAFGNPGGSGVNHVGGVIRNNFIYSSLAHDVAIEMAHSQGWLVAHNTALLLNPVSNLTWGMEARFTDTQGEFVYNLTNMPIWGNREGAQGVLSGNLTDAQSSWFVNPAIGDLHLRPDSLDAIDRATLLNDVSDDYDGDLRPIGIAADVGADEYDFKETKQTFFPLVLWNYVLNALHR